MYIYIYLYSIHKHTPSHTSLNGRFGSSFTKSSSILLKGSHTNKQGNQFFFEMTHPNPVDEEGSPSRREGFVNGDDEGYPVSHEITNETSKLNNNDLD